MFRVNYLVLFHSTPTQAICNFALWLISELPQLLAAKPPLKHILSVYPCYESFSSYEVGWISLFTQLLFQTVNVTRHCNIQCQTYNVTRQPSLDEIEHGKAHTTLLAENKEEFRSTVLDISVNVSHEAHKLISQQVPHLRSIFHIPQWREYLQFHGKGRVILKGLTLVSIAPKVPLHLCRNHHGDFCNFYIRQACAHSHSYSKRAHNFKAFFKTIGSHTILGNNFSLSAVYISRMMARVGLALHFCWINGSIIA